MGVVDSRSSFNELTVFGVNHCCFTVDEQMYELFRVVYPDSESDNEDELELYLTHIKTVNSPSQSMARTKQRARKLTGRPPGRSPGGKLLARFGSPITCSHGNLLEGDSKLEEAANLRERVLKERSLEWWHYIKFDSIKGL